MNKQNTIAAIDVGSSKVATLIVSQSADSNRLNAIGVASVPSRGIRKSQVVDIEEAMEAITQSVEAAERMAGFSINSAVISISGDHLRSQNSKGVVAIANPEHEVVQEDVDRVIEAARALSLPSSQEILHVIPREFTVDSQSGVRDPLGMTGVRLEAEAHIVTGASAVVRNLTKCIDELAIHVDDVVFAGLASAEAVLTDTEKELGTVLVDIGGGTTSVAIFVEGALSYSAVIPIGAKNITNDLAIGLRISLESAEKIKRFLSQLATLPPHQAPETPPANKKDSKAADEIDLGGLNLKEDLKTASKKTLIDGIIRPRLNEIFSLVGEEIKRSGYGSMIPAGIVITGGGAETVEVVNSCKRTLQLPARVGIPGGLSGLTDEISSPAYATLTGLILYSRKLPTKTHTKPSISLPITKLPGKDVFVRITAFLNLFYLKAAF